MKAQLTTEQSEVLNQSGDPLSLVDPKTHRVYVLVDQCVHPHAIDWQDVVYRQLETIPEMPQSFSLTPENPKFDEVLQEKNIGLGAGGYRAVSHCARQ